MSEDHKKQLNILGEIRDQIKRLADLAEPTRLIMKPPPADDALVEAVKFYANTDNYVDGAPGNIVGGADSDHWEDDLGKIARDALATIKEKS